MTQKDVYNLERLFGTVAGAVHLAPLQSKVLLLGTAPKLMKAPFHLIGLFCLLAGSSARALARLKNLLGHDC